MCEPVSLALLGTGLAATVGSTAMQSSAANQAASARNKALRQEMARQDAYRKQAAQAFDRSLASQEKPVQETQQSQIQQDRQASLTNAVKAANEYAPTTGSAPTEVNTEIARKLHQALTAGRQTAAQLARLGSFDSNQFANRIALNEQANKIGLAADFARGSANVLPYELNAANQEGANLRGFGDILGAAGGLATSAGLSGQFADFFGQPAYGALGRFGAKNLPVGSNGMIAGGI